MVAPHPSRLSTAPRSDLRTARQRIGFRRMPTVRDATFDLFREPRDDDDVRQPGLDRAADARRLPRRLPLRARPAGGGRGRHGRRLRPGLGQHHRSSTCTPRPGVGNAMGAIFNAQANHSPLLVTAGQQARAQITLQANLTNRDATRMPHPLVKWSYEPPRAEDVPLALAHGAHLAALPPRGPVFVSLPMDDWDAEVDEADAREAIARKVSGRAAADPEAVRALADRARRRHQPGAGRRPRHRRQRRLGRGDRPRRAPAPAGLGDARRPAAAGSASPRATPTSAACCRRRSARSAQTLEGHDLILVVGSSVFPYYPLHPRAAAARGGEAGRDHQRPRRGGAGADGRRDRRRRQADPGGAARGGARVDAARRPSRTRARRKSRPADPLNPSTVHTALGRGLPRGRRSSCSSRPPAPWRCATSCGSRAPAATTSAPAAASASASPPRSACSSPSPTARSSACSARARPSTRSPPSGAPSPTRSPVTFLVLRNEEYAILKWFAEVEQVERRARPRPAEARRRRGRRGLRRQGAPGRATATRCATRSRRRSPPRSRSWSKSR